MIYDLFPTRIAVEKLSEDFVLSLTEKYAINPSKSYKDILSDIDIKMIESLISNNYPGKYIVCDGWVRSGYNNFDIHCDSHYGNQLVAVLQLYGDKESGGDLVLYDPSWSNPQWMSDTQNSDTNTYTFKFTMGQLIIFPSNVWHKVTEYRGKTNRITLNLMIRRVE